MKIKKTRPHSPFKIITGAIPVYVVLSAFLLSGSAHAEGNTLLKPVKNIDVGWISPSSQLNEPQKAAIEVDGGRILLDLASHTSWRPEGIDSVTVTSSNDSVANASIEQGKLAISIRSYGTVQLTLYSVDSDGQSFVDTLQLVINKIGDTTGDGVITSADALLIMRAVNGIITPTSEQMNSFDINRDGKITSADSALLLSQYVGKNNGPAASNYIVSIQSVNDAPVAYNVKPAVMSMINGKLTAQADYKYLDAESDMEGSTLIKWYKGSLLDGSDKQLIPNATGKQYIVESSDEGAYLYYTVTPVATMGTLHGVMVGSPASEQLPDQAPPVVTDVAAPANRYYGSGQTLKFTVNMSEPVSVSGGSPVMELNVGGQTKNAVFDDLESSGSKMVFTYTMAAGDTDDDGILISRIGLPQGVTVKDQAGNNADLTIAAVDTSGIKVDTDVPAATTTDIPGDGLYPEGHQIKVAVNWSEPVQVTGGTPVLNLRIGTANRNMEYMPEESSASKLVFAYTVADGEEDTDGVELGDLQLEGSSITDRAGNLAVLALGPVNTSGIKIDTRGPVVNSVTLPPNGAYKAGSKLIFILNMNEPYTLQGGSPSLELTIGGVARTAAYDPVASTPTALVFTYKVSANEMDLDGIEMGAVQLSAATIQDSAGNTGNLDLLTQNTSGIVIDTAQPLMTSLTPGNEKVASSTSGDLVMTFDEPVTAVNGKKVTVTNTVDNSKYILDVTDTDKVVINGNKITFKNPGLQDNSSYTVDVESEAFMDKAGNLYEGLNGSANWSFTTPDQTPPSVTSTTPNNKAVGVSRTDDFVIQFSESVVVGDSSKRIIIRKASDSSEVAAYTAGDSINTSLSGSALTITNPGLDENTSYYVEIDSGAYEDTAGNPFSGLSGLNGWSFSTPDARSLNAVILDVEFSEKQMRSDPYNMGAILTLNIAGDTFKTTLSAADFELNHAPAGLTIMGAEYMSDDMVMLALDYDGTDFDQDITDFSITAKPSALISGGTTTSNEMTITADVEQESPVFISEYLYGGAEKVVLELFNAGSVQEAGLSLEIYTTDQAVPYVTPVRTDLITEPNFDIPIDPNNFLVAINPVYNSYMDDNGGIAYNVDLKIPYTPTIKAIVLKKGNKVLDCIGSPTANRAILQEPMTTMRRKVSIQTGSPAYIPSQWDFLRPMDFVTNEDFYKGIRIR